MRKKHGLGGDCYAKGGSVSPGHVKKELAFMRDKGAPKDMIASEKKEHGLAGGGGSGAPAKSRFVGHGQFNFGGKKAKPFAQGGGVDGIAEGQNVDIGDDSRARALAWLAKQKAGEAQETPPKPKARPSVTIVIGAPTGPGAGRGDAAAELSARKVEPAAAAGREAGRDMDRALAINKDPIRSPLRARLAAFKQDEGEKSARAVATLAATRKRILDGAPKRSPLAELDFAGGGSIDGCAQRGKTRG